jgi:hypothetical protein
MPYLWETDPLRSRCMFTVGGTREDELQQEEVRCPATAELNAIVCKEHLALLPRQRDKAAQILLLNSNRAAHRLLDALDAVDERVRLKAAESLLNRVGLSERQNITVTSGSDETGHDAMVKYLFEAGEQGSSDAALPDAEASA